MKKIIIISIVAVILIGLGLVFFYGLFNKSDGELLYQEVEVGGIVNKYYIFSNGKVVYEMGFNEKKLDILIKFRLIN